MSRYTDFSRKIRWLIPESTLRAHFLTSIAISIALAWSSCGATAAGWEEESAMAEQHFKQGNFADSQRSLLNALSVCPPDNRVGVLMNLANVQERAGNPEGARKTLSTAMTYAEQSANPAFREMIGRAMNALEQRKPQAAALPDQLSAGPMMPPMGAKTGQKSSAPNTASAKKPTQTLQGGVTFQDKLQPLDPTLGPGNSFDQPVATALLTRPQGSDFWYRVPKGLAGTWMSTQATLVYFKDHTTGEESTPNHTYDAKSSATLGLCQDRLGGVWDQANTNYWSVATQYRGSQSRSFVRKCDLVRSSDAELIMYNEGVTFEIDQRSKKILTSFQYAGYNIYRPLADGIVRWEQRRRVYDDQGRVTSSSVNVANDQRIVVFMPGMAGPEKEKSFEMFLRRQGLLNLVPAGTVSPTSAKQNSPPQQR